MWDTYRLPASGNFSLRKIALLFFAVLTAAFLWAVSFAPTTHAADATWEGDAIVKDGGNKYTKESGAIPGIPPGYQAYVFRPNGAQSTTAQVIYMPDNADVTKAVTAQQATYDIVNGRLNGPRGEPVVVTIEAKAANATQKEKTQCDVAGIGWIVCMISRFLASGMDNFFRWISTFLEVKPITGDTDSGLYKAWSVMLGLANLAFVLAFLMIIYSQITSVGFSNYNIKKMIPKLIIAAVLVNISYYICALAVDVSNILGHSLQQALIDIRNSLPSPSPTGVDWFNWKNLTEYILSGGTIAAAGFAGWTAFTAGTGGAISALVPLLVPILVAGTLAFVIALLLLAARQALITVLIVISPLAFVAYLLPNTEKWFERWRELFTTMLMVFPLFSLLFGGSQLASYIIIQNADQASVVILGLFVQAAPLALTPFLVKFSGSLIGRLAGMVNDRSKGIYDNANNWARERADKRKGIAQERAARGLGTALQRHAFRREKSRLDREAFKKRGEEALDAGWHEDARYRAHHAQRGYTEDRKKTAESQATEHMERLASRSQTWQDFRGHRRLSDDVTKNLQAREDAAWEEAKSKGVQTGNQYSGLATRAQKEAEQAQAIAYQAGTAQAMQKLEYANEVVKNNALAKQAGGIDIVGGADSARAAALAAIKKSKIESTAEGRALFEHFNLSSSDRQKLAKGVEVTGKSDDGRTHIFKPQESKYVRMAAIEQQVTYGTIEERQELILKTGAGKELHEFRDIIADAMVKGSIGQTANYLGGKTIDDVRSGKLMGTGDLLRAAATAIAKGKLSPEQLLNQDKTSMETIVEAVKQLNAGQIHLDNTEQAMALPAELARLFQSADRAITDGRINIKLGERKNAMEELRAMGQQQTPYTNPSQNPPGGPPPTP